MGKWEEKGLASREWENEEMSAGHWEEIKFL